MDCIALANCVKGASGGEQQGLSAVTADSAKSRHFEQLVNNESTRQPVYVAPQDSAPSGNPMTSVMNQFQSMDLSSFALKKANVLAPPVRGGAAGDVQYAGREAVAAQAEILRTVMMMEVMNTTKQGVTTLFQQQG